MSTPNAFNRGACFGALMLTGAYAVNWLLSGQRDAASELRQYLVVAQAAVCFGAAWWVRRGASRALGTPERSRG
jgi:hypothetical protein